MTRLVPSTDRGRVLLVSLIGLALGLALSPAPWLGLVAPSGLAFALAVLSPPETPEGEA